MRRVMEGRLGCALFGGVLAAFCAGTAFALPPDTKDPRAIMRAAFENRGGQRGRSKMKMTIRDKAGTRERVMINKSLRFEAGRKSLILIEAPADVRGTGFLSIDYDKGERADEQWLYLPRLRRTARVPASGKSDSFVGSDFSYADLSQQDPEQFELKLIGESSKVGDDDCWQIEVLPRTPRIAEENGYTKSHIWISKSKLIPLQFKAWTTTEGKTKYFKATDVRQIDGLWTPHRMQMRTLKGSELESETIIEVSEVANAATDVSDDEFTQQRLERGL